MSSVYHAKYFANELTRRSAEDGVAKLSVSLFDAAVDLNPHQIEAALFAFRSSLSRGVLLADEVGLGKTIEAGLILCQYWAERRRKLLVICPASLRKQWSLELQDKFNLPSVIAGKLVELKTLIMSKKIQDWNFKSLHAIGFGQHLYYPLLHCSSKNIEISPVDLNDGERAFVEDLRTYYEANKPFFEKRELYLLRNLSRGRGVGFFEAGNFHPDFILWLLTPKKQFITFVDPKGLRNLEGKYDPKIAFYQTIKELEARLGDPEVSLASFIVSNTSYVQVKWWSDGMSKEAFAECNVLFQGDDRDTYVGKMLGSIAGSRP